MVNRAKPKLSAAKISDPAKNLGGKRQKRKKTKSAMAASLKKRLSKGHDAAAAKGEKDFSIKIYDSKGKELERFQLDKKLFTGIVNRAALYQAVRMYNANQRQGTADTKTRGEVSGGGKKPWRQKGTGRARAGSIRSPLWRGGGVIFGPHPRDYHYEIPKKIRRVAFLSSLNLKFNENGLIGIDSIKLEQPKTKFFKAIMDALKLKGASLFVLEKIDEATARAGRNIKGVSIKLCKDFNTMDVLKCGTVVIQKSALEKLEERFK